MNLSKTYYHGSPSKFCIFESPKSGKDYGVGIYLTQNYNEAIQYAFGADRSGFIYEIVPVKCNFFDVTNKNHAQILIDHLNRKGLSKGGEFDFLESSTGFDSSMRYSWYHRISSMFSLNDRNGDDMWELLSSFGFDSILDPIKGWVVISNPSQINIMSTKKINIKEYEFKGKPGSMIYVKL